MLSTTTSLEKLLTQVGRLFVFTMCLENKGWFCVLGLSVH